MLLRRAAAVAGAALRCSQQQQQQLPHHQRCMATAALSWYHPQQQQPTQQQSRFRLAARPATVAAGSSVTASVLSVAKPTFQAPAGTRSYMGQSFPVRKLQLFQRQGRGKSYCRKARRVGLVPGVVLGMLPNGKKADPILVWARESEVKLHMRERGMELESTLYDVTIGDETLRVLPRQLALHPVREFPTRLNFVRYIGEASKRGARIAIPFRAVNQDRCPAIKEGGWLLLLQHRLSVFAKGPRIPNRIIIDLRGKKAGSKIMASELYLNEGLMLRHPPGADKSQDFAVAKLVGVRRKGGAAAGDDDSDSDS